jgi:hypothetical protein
MRKLRILSESYVYYKKSMRQMSHSRISSHQNYNETRTATYRSSHRQVIPGFLGNMIFEKS